MVTILRKTGWVLNPKDKIVNSILKRVEANNGECPCVNDSEDKHCPCSNYRIHNKCCCGLYLKIDTGASCSNCKDFNNSTGDNIEGD